MTSRPSRGASYCASGRFSCRAGSCGGRGYSPAKVELVRRWFHGEFSPREYLPIFWRISGAYSHRSGWLALARKVADGGWRSRMRPEALIFAGRQLLDGWSVMDPPC